MRKLDYGIIASILIIIVMIFAFNHPSIIKSNKADISRTIYEDSNTSYIYIYGSIEPPLALHTLSTIDLIKRRNSTSKRRLVINKIIVTINSPGGSVTESIAIIDGLEDLKKQGVKIITIGRGCLLSGGFYIFICGDERIAGENTIFMVHGPQIITPPPNSFIPPSPPIDDPLMDMIKNIFINMLIKYTSIPKEKLDLMIKDNLDIFMDAKEAVRLRVADKIG